jgi:signal transduction histidine kinase
MFDESFSSDNNTVKNSLESDSSNSEVSKFDKQHNISEIFRPHVDRDKIVITCIDTGIGIKERDRIKLFKLFGTLQNTRQMNT